MSIHFKLNRGATTITLSRHYYVDNQRKTTKLTTLDFTSNHIDLPDSLSKIEQEKAINWISEQKNLIQKAYTRYSRLGLIGGTPVVAESGSFNCKFKGLQGYNSEAPAYSFLGCIKDARKISLKVDAPDAHEMEDIINSKELTTISKSIIGAFCKKLISNPELFAHKIYASDDIEQLVEANLLLSKFISASKIQQGRVRAGGVEDRVDSYFKKLMATDEGYLVSKKLKVKTLLKQINEPKQPKEIKLIDKAITDEQRKELNHNISQLIKNKTQNKPVKSQQNQELWNKLKARIGQISA